MHIWPHELPPDDPTAPPDISLSLVRFDLTERNTRRAFLSEVIDLHTQDSGEAALRAMRQHVTHIARLRRGVGLLAVCGFGPEGVRCGHGDMDSDDRTVRLGDVYVAPSAADPGLTGAAIAEALLNRSANNLVVNDPNGVLIPLAGKDVEGATVVDVRRAITAAHPGLRDMFENGRLTYREY